MLGGGGGLPNTPGLLPDVPSRREAPVCPSLLASFVFLISSLLLRVTLLEFDLL